MLMKHEAKAPIQNSNDAIIAKPAKKAEEKPKKKAKKKSTKE